MPAYDTSRITYKGVAFTVAKYYDEQHAPPWEEYDGHGVVTDYLFVADADLVDPRSDFRPISRWDGNRRRYYDWGKSLDRARVEEWGLGDEQRAKLADRLKREPTADEVLEEAVRLDYEYLKGWCFDEWHYCGIVVTLAGTDIERSSWGIESNAAAYHNEVARELAQEIMHDAAGELRTEIKRLETLAAALPKG